MISKITGKNQITIPAKIAEREKIKPGSFISWEIGEEEHVLIVRVFPDPVSMTRELKGKGRSIRKSTESKKTGKKHPGKGDAVERLIRERETEDVNGLAANSEKA